MKKGDYIDLTNVRFGRHVPIKRIGQTKNGTSRWLCLCDCGNQTIVDTSALNRGTSQSCGCLANDIQRARLLQHGMRHSKEYNTWIAIKQRCHNSRYKGYKNYGGRGITVCDQWKNSFEAFYADMGKAPENTSIERIDNTGNYEPSNCKWATAKEQARNRRSNKYIEYMDERKTIAEWGEIKSLQSDTIIKRLSYKWPIKDALEVSPIDIDNKPRRRRYLLKQEPTSKPTKTGLQIGNTT